jgi:hypothetical protein
VSGEIPHESSSDSKKLSSIDTVKLSSFASIDCFRFGMVQTKKKLKLVYKASKQDILITMNKLCEQGRPPITCSYIDYHTLNEFTKVKLRISKNKKYLSLTKQSSSSCLMSLIKAVCCKPTNGSVKKKVFFE